MLHRTAVLSALAVLGFARCGAEKTSAADASPEASSAPDSSQSAMAVHIGGLESRTPLGAAVTLKAETAGRGNTTFQWSATCGTLAATDGAATTWTAPLTAGKCEISVVASSGGDKVTGSAATGVTNATKLVATDATGDGSAAGFDLKDVHYGVVGATLYLDVALPDFDPKTAQIEIFLLQTAAGMDIHSLGLKAGATMFWTANRPAGHPHYHWQEVAAPASVHIATAGGSLTAEVALSEVGLDQQSAARIGVAGAPTVVAKTASYTDRLPDDLVVTATDVTGLKTVDLK